MRNPSLVFLAALAALTAVVRAQPQAPAPTLVRAGRMLDVRSGVYRADQGIWVEGDPLANLRDLQNVKFVMKGGAVVRDDLHAR
jgi:hypothetical protein